ncbi:MAG TPA: ABC transporter ATP-binding protein [Gemmatimonadales bacterium]|nr:ABC transporter ATP-binding protein [Gemmatimonadales bacterium]
MSAAIETRGLNYQTSREFGIHDLALNVPAGAIYGFLGPNGCGKTTTIRLLLGLLRPDSGTIAVLGHTIPAGLPEVLARTGVLPDRPQLYRYLTVGESMAYHRAFYPHWDDAWATALLGEFRLLPRQRVGGLSKGETAKLMLLLALCQRPDLLMLDEPMDGLDPVVRRDVLAALLDYVSTHKATVLVSSHLVHELERFCDWVGVMDRGRLVVELPMDAFRNGNKRLRVHAESATFPADAPFTVLARERDGGMAETWVVRGWQPAMSEWFGRSGVVLRDVSDLDLEDGFVELLRAFRTQPVQG